MLGQARPGEGIDYVPGLAPEAAALDVHLQDFLGRGFPRGSVLPEEEGYGLVRGPHSAGGVDDRRHLPGDVSRPELLAQQGRLLEELGEARPRPLIEGGEPAAHEDAVLVA